MKRRVRFDVSGRFRTVVFGDWKLVWTPGASSGEFELFDLSRDPYEADDLYTPHHPEAQRLEALLFEWLRESDVPTEKPSEDDTMRLRALGYVE